MMDTVGPMDPREKLTALIAGVAGQELAVKIVQALEDADYVVHPPNEHPDNDDRGTIEIVEGGIPPEVLAELAKAGQVVMINSAKDDPEAGTICPPCQRGDHSLHEGPGQQEHPMIEFLRAMGAQARGRDLAIGDCISAGGREGFCTCTGQAVTYVQ